MSKPTKMQKQMIAAVDHQVEIRIVNGYKTFIGKCVEYIQPLDNEPEVASILLETPDYDGLTELIEDEIESISVKD